MHVGLTLKWSLTTRTRSSKVVPGLKGFRWRISSEPQRPPSSVLQTMHGDRWKRGLRWNATSARGCTLLPQVKSTWNLEETQDTTAGWEGWAQQHAEAAAGFWDWDYQPVSIIWYWALDDDHLPWSQATQDGPTEGDRLWRTNRQTETELNTWYLLTQPNEKHVIFQVSTAHCWDDRKQAIFLDSSGLVAEQANYSLWATFGSSHCFIFSV